ncbi:MAG TPA: DUF1566 domain-containing protein [Dehalococcoidia bacterium]|nr:DUF1566 domain-containing protein [Dehalococcoidia bacterium]
MNSLSQELKQVVKRRLDQAPAAEVLRIVSTLCADDGVAPAAPVRLAGPRFTKISDDGRAMAMDSGQWVAVHDAVTDLVWTRAPLEGRHQWKAAHQAAESCALCGQAGWRLPTVTELLTLVDYSRADPAIDTSFFTEAGNWYWTSTPCAPSPSVSAWFVYFDNGYSFWRHQNYEGLVRAVRAGQSLGL